MESKQGSCLCQLDWRISRKITGAALWTAGTPSLQGPWVSHHQGLEGGAWAGAEHALPWRGTADPILPWSVQLPTAVVAIARHRGAGLLQHRCGVASLGPTKHGRTSKEHMPQQWPFPAASCPACSEPYVHPAPEALLEQSCIWSGAGWAQRCSPGTSLCSASLPAGLCQREPAWS